MSFKLRMMGFFIMIPTVMYGNNQSVVISTTTLSCKLCRKCNTLSYHRTREAIAMRDIIFGFVKSEANWRDMVWITLTNNWRCALPSVFRICILLSFSVFFRGFIGQQQLNFWIAILRGISYQIIDSFHIMMRVLWNCCSALSHHAYFSLNKCEHGILSSDPQW